jgi:hypothetical protein
MDGLTMILLETCDESWEFSNEVDSELSRESCICPREISLDFLSRLLRSREEGPPLRNLTEEDTAILLQPRYCCI